jgi:hypothetical protein
MRVFIFSSDRVFGLNAECLPFQSIFHNLLTDFLAFSNQILLPAYIFSMKN